MRAFGVTDKGTVRRENQDCFQLRLMEEQDMALLVLCDGMGGAVAGSLASSVAAEAFMAHAALCLKETPTPEPAVIARESAVYANIRVFDRAKTSESFEGMGTTLVGAVVQGEKTALVNVGDSRCYLYSGGALTQLTRDHSLVEELVQQGVISREEARTHPKKNVITRALGLRYREKCDVIQPRLETDDMLLLCSDGLSNTLSDGEIAAVLGEQGEPEKAGRELMRLALEYGAADNVTALIFRR